ncbi:MAG TPA: CYTH and CHAD domain-containing protein [Acidimicrobiales bacterium]|nr:CYTH and CHAD domain-containing protein [Acidimicrobiales bacterium]
MQQLEQEVKLDIGPDWSLPDLSGVLPGVRAHPMPELALETTYFDTPDLRLARRHVTVRFRRETEAVPRSRRGGNGPPPQGPTSEVWTVKLPSSTDGTLLTRTELTWVALPGRPTANPGTAGLRASSRRTSSATSRPASASSRLSPKSPAGVPPTVHPEAAAFVHAVALGRPLVAVAHLVTTRQRTELRTSDGRRLAEIDHDIVSGKAFVTAERDLGADSGEVRFSEIEVELSEGSSLEILEAVVAKLQESGARPTSGGSKLATVLQLSAGPKAARKRRQGPLMADLLQQQARSCLDTLLDHDPAIRAEDDDPEHIHRTRVATRRLRTVLRGFEPAVSGTPGGSPPAWFVELSEELKWFGGVLGAARDADVRLESLEKDCAALPSPDAAGSAALLDAAREQQATNHADLLEAMAKGRYLQLLRALDALSSRTGSGSAEVTVQFWAMLSRPAATEMPSLAKQQWISTVKAVGRLGSQPADEQLHQVRIRAKRLRYLAEVAAPVVRRPEDRRAASETARAATALQDVLGELHDAVVREQWLRDAASRRPARAKSEVLVATGLAAGQLIAAARESQRAQRLAWTGAWDRLNRKNLLRWTAGPGARNSH